jgi:hypothetical protein
MAFARPLRKSLALLALLWAGAARADDVSLHGYAEAELVGTPADVSWVDGGLGKLRWGGDGSSGRVTPEISALVIEGSAVLPLDLRAMADIRYDPKQKSALDLVDAALRWQPPPAGDLSWSARVGAFFPPFSQENQDIGWSSPWTLSYSALDSWIGEELRTIGGEATLRWRLGSDTIGLTGAVYGWNDAAGVLLAERGWDIGNRALGLFDHQRLPNVVATLFGEPAPYYTPEFTETDNAPGWYGQATWEHPGIGRFELDRYDNLTDPTSERAEVYGWHTEFWSLGFSRGFGPFKLIAQGLTGGTTVNPDGDGAYTTDFHTAYLLAGWTEDPWRAALRIETFDTEGLFPEHGKALTAALNWQPLDWLRVTGEVAVVESWRIQRLLAGIAARQVETEPQLGLRVSF